METEIAISIQVNKKMNKLIVWMTQIEFSHLCSRLYHRFLPVKRGILVPIAVFMGAQTPEVFRRFGNNVRSKFHNDPSSLFIADFYVEKHSRVFVFRHFVRFGSIFVLRNRRNWRFGNVKLDQWFLDFIDLMCLLSNLSIADKSYGLLWALLQVPSMKSV